MALTRKSIAAHFLEQNAEAPMRIASSPGIFSYYCSILFPAAETPHSFPICFLPLLNSYSLSSLLIQLHLGIKVTQAQFEASRTALLRDTADYDSKTTMLSFNTPGGNLSVASLKSLICTGLSSSPDLELIKLYISSLGPLALLKLLLSFEISHHNIYTAGNDFFIFLFKMLTLSQQSELFNSHDPSPILLILSDYHTPAIDFYKFCALENTTDAFRLATELDYCLIRRTITNSRFILIQAKLLFFYQLFPELQLPFQVISPNRSSYLSLQEDIPMDYKLLNTYIELIKAKTTGNASIMLSSHCSSIIPPVSYDGLLNIKISYIIRILAAPSKKLLTYVLDPWLAADDQLFDLFLQKKPKIGSYSLFSKYVSTIHYKFTAIVDILKKTKNPYYEKIILNLLSAFPRKNNIEIIRANLACFSKIFSSQLQTLLLKWE